MSICHLSLKMVDATKKPLHIPPWQIPYLEKHRIFELFHELGRELVIQQPDDHLLFLKQILYNASRSRNVARAVILAPPKINCLEVAKGIAEITKQIVITENSLLAYKGRTGAIDSEQKAKYISQLVRRDNAYELGWLLIDCIRDVKDAKALLKQGILPTHVIHLIPSFYPPLTELSYCHVPPEWPEYRRRIIEIRDVFKKVLKEVHIQQRTLSDVVLECVDLLNIQAGKCAIKPRILVLGPRGSGRKTQARLLAKQQGLIHVDFENLICQYWQSESELGKKLRACKNEVCFHSELLAQVIQKRVLEADCLENGWVLTGFPYSRKDFEYLDCIHTPPNRVIFLECDLSVCKERLLSRKVNAYTGSVTNLQESSEAEHIKTLKPHPKDDKDYIDAELSYYCENYGDMRKYCGLTANCVNGDQSERWIYENILAIMANAPAACDPRKPFQGMSYASISSDSCCCTPVPSKVFDCYMTKF